MMMMIREYFVLSQANVIGWGYILPILHVFSLWEFYLEKTKMIRDVKVIHRKVFIFKYLLTSHYFLAYRNYIHILISWFCRYDLYEKIMKSTIRWRLIRKSLKKKFWLIKEKPKSYSKPKCEDKQDKA